jgi:hypothetical protein
MMGRVFRLNFVFVWIASIDSLDSAKLIMSVWQGASLKCCLRVDSCTLSGFKRLSQGGGLSGGGGDDTHSIKSRYINEGRFFRSAAQLCTAGIE